MKKIIILIIFMGIMIITPVTAMNQISWKTFMSSIAIAKTQNKPIMIYMYTDRCGYCRLMERSVLSKAKVVNKLNRHFISVRINGSHFYKFQRDLQKIYKNKASTVLREMVGRGGVPRTIFLNKNAEIITVIPGFSSVVRSSFTELLGFIKDKCYKKNYSFYKYVVNGKCK